MHIYNSLSNKIEKFNEIDKGKINMYVCGPTVYDHPHIGNARPLIVFDMVYRFFKALGYQVKYVSNYTDIDDKIINKALELDKSASYVSSKYIDAYEDLSKKLNILNPQKIKVTDTMDEIIHFIQELINDGFAYEIDGDVYFKVNKVDDYGKLSKQKVEDLMVGARIDENIKKENPLDFTLWKKTSVGENFSSPWSQGRPGWHTECVVMINDAFAMDKIDIHGGGLDLKFPHHENEMAQASACCNSNLANYWMHNGLVTIGDKKMSKSQGKLILAKDMVEDLGSNLVRWIMLSAHYRMALKLSDDLIEQSEKELDKIFLALNQAFVFVVLNRYKWNSLSDHQLLQLFYKELKNDFNTANAYKVIFDSTKKLNASLRVKEVDMQKIVKEANAIIMMLDVLGIVYRPQKITNFDVENYQRWQKAKKEKNYEVADKLREKLSKKGLI